MATACTVAVLYDGDERPEMVAVVAAVRGGGGGVLHSAFDRTISRKCWHGRELGSSTMAASVTASLERSRVSRREREGAERMGRSSASALEEPGALGRAAARPGAAGTRAGREPGMGRHVPDMWPPQGHFNEHVVLYEVGKVEGDFWPVLG
jgi:hypothetical protein